MPYLKLETHKVKFTFEIEFDFELVFFVIPLTFGDKTLRGDLIAIAIDAGLTFFSTI